MKTFSVIQLKSTTSKGQAYAGKKQDSIARHTKLVKKQDTAK